MKIMKKLAVTLLALMLVCPCFANVAFAADGVAFFTDLETKVGDEFTITGTVVAKNDVIGDVTIEMEYDTKYMQFISGDSGVKNSSGKITFEGSGDGSSDRITFDMTFQALAEGDTQMDQTGAEVTTSSGATVNCTMGYSAISIGEGDPSKIKNLSEDEEKSNEETADQGALVAGEVAYEISEEFTESEIPTGFVAAEVTYNEKTYNGVSQQVAGVNAVFALSEEGLSKFFIINNTTGELYPMEEFIISDEYSIFILQGKDEVKMPEEYVEASVKINDVDYPVWIAPDRDGFYVFYAMNNLGEKSLYLYDSEEHTYQRMETPKTAESEEHEVSAMDKALAFAENNVVWILVGAGCSIIVLAILAIVLAVKLKHRNIELDDLYDEYGIDLDNEAEAKGKGSKNFKEIEEKDYLDSDEFADGHEDDEYDDNDYEYEYEDDGYEYEDDEYEYEYEDDEYEYENGEADEYEDDEYDYYEEDELADLRRDYAAEVKDVSLNSNFDSYYDDDDFEDDDYYETRSEAQLRRDDTFEMNFIDLE